MKKKLYIKTIGCQMNEYDSSRLVDLLKETHSIILVDSYKDANILILNTCSIREKSQAKVHSILGKWRRLKLSSKDIIIIFAGCVATQNGRLMYNKNKYIDLIVGPQALHNIPKMIDSVISKRKKIIDICFYDGEKFKVFPSRKIYGITAYVSIIEGCNNYCTFCIVPYTRGHEVSRNFDEIMAEIVSLRNNGIVEIILLGQNVSSYNFNGSNCKNYKLSDLLKSISGISGIKRINFISSNPIDFSIDLIESYASINQLSNNLHLPLQSASNKILKLMKRGYSVEKYENIIKQLRSIRPNIEFSTDIIVGFPGETKSNFDETLNFIKRINFDHSFSFIYSIRPGTPAEIFSNSLLEVEKKKRLSIIKKTIKNQGDFITKKMIGTEQNILIDKICNDSKKIIGRAENNRIVKLTFIKNIHIGDIVKVKINKILNNNIFGSAL